MHNYCNNCVISGHPMFEIDARTQHQDIQESPSDWTFYSRGKVVSISHVLIGTTLTICVCVLCITSVLFFYVTVGGKHTKCACHGKDTKWLKSVGWHKEEGGKNFAGFAGIQCCVFIT